MKSEKEIRKWVNEWLWKSNNREYNYMAWPANKIEEIIRMLIEFQKQSN